MLYCSELGLFLFFPAAPCAARGGGASSGRFCIFDLVENLNVNVVPDGRQVTRGGPPNSRGGGVASFLSRDKLPVLVTFR